MHNELKLTCPFTGQIVDWTDEKSEACNTLMKLELGWSESGGVTLDTGIESFTHPALCQGDDDREPEPVYEFLADILHGGGRPRLSVKYEVVELETDSTHASFEPQGGVNYVPHPRTINKVRAIFSPDPEAFADTVRAAIK